MDIIILCETPKKESYELSGMVFYKEYAICDNLTNEERDYFANTYHMREIYGVINPVITMRRRVNTLLGENTFLDWDYFDVFKNRASACDGFGDSDYWYNGISMSGHYTQAIEKNNKVKKLNKELAEISYNIDGELKNKYQDIYDTRLKECKLYRKAKKGIAPAEIIARIRDDVSQEYFKELESAKIRQAEIKEELLNIQ